MLAVFAIGPINKIGEVRPSKGCADVRAFPTHGMIAVRITKVGGLRVSL